MENELKVMIEVFEAKVSRTEEEYFSIYGNSTIIINK